MRTRTRPPALRTFCAECGGEISDTRAMLELGDGTYVHTHECEGFTLEPTVGAPLVLVAGLLGFFGGFLLLEALGWLRPAAVVIACVVCVALAWEICRGRSS